MTAGSHVWSKPGLVQLQLTVAGSHWRSLGQCNITKFQHKYSGTKLFLLTRTVPLPLCCRLRLQQGATVIMACRSMQAAATAREDILADPRNAGPVPDPAGRLILLHVDFEDFETIPKFVEAFHATGLPLHVLVNNAGVHLKPHKKVRRAFWLLWLSLAL